MVYKRCAFNDSTFKELYSNTMYQITILVVDELVIKIELKADIVDIDNNYNLCKNSKSFMNYKTE